MSKKETKSSEHSMHSILSHHSSRLLRPRHPYSLITCLAIAFLGVFSAFVTFFIKFLSLYCIVHASTTMQQNSTSYEAPSTYSQEHNTQSATGRAAGNSREPSYVENNGQLDQNEGEGDDK